MKKIYLVFVALMATATTSFAQFVFDVEVEATFTNDVVVYPPSPLKNQVLFVGGFDTVATTATYGNGAGFAVAKQWHDFIGFTPDTESDDLGWVSVNHERINANDSIGDGGGMTVFKVSRDPRTEELVLEEQTLADGRTGIFFNVDFVNTVGNTGMNCGGIVGPGGRIWTAEEWFRSGNDRIVDRELGRFVIGEGTIGGSAAPNGFPGFDGDTIEKYQNYNWMVEIDPKEAVAVRKQYNWGRQAFEGGAFLNDSVVFVTEDATPGMFTKFVADTPGDFTSGKTFVFKHDADDPSLGNWVEMDNTNLEEMLYFKDSALSRGASMFNRLEWATQIDGKIYMTETGRDNAGSRWLNAVEEGGVLNPHIYEAVRTRVPGLDAKPDSEIEEFVLNGNFMDHYGRVLVYDPATDQVEIFLDGGEYYETSPALADYPDKHLSNPDGLSFIKVDGKTFMIIQEDLNGTTNGRTPAGISNRTCEMFLLDMSIPNPSLEDLVRIAVVPQGAEVTGAIGTPDGKTIICNSQHPSTSNPFPYNNSLTFAITGWDFAVSAIDEFNALEASAKNAIDFVAYPNPVSQTLNFNKIVDCALYNAEGKRMRVYRNVKSIDVFGLEKGIYFLQASLLELEEGASAQPLTKKIVIK